MRIYELGEGTPEVAVVAAIHGDEPCGVHAVERLVGESPALKRPVKLIVANEAALEADARYLDDDLNRAFPGEATPDSHERRLAADLVREIRGCTVLSLHSTQSYARPFALVDRVGAVAQSVCPHLPVDALVETGSFADGRLIQHAHTIEVECGLQGSQAAAENAYWLTRAFLAATGVLSVPTDEDATLSLATADRDDVPVFRLEERIPKPPADEYEVFAHNFEPVETGDRFAVADGETFTADESFYPVLLSAYGYENVFGYAAERLGALAETADVEA